jgi:hypothetical protein
LLRGLHIQIQAQQDDLISLLLFFHVKESRLEEEVNDLKYNDKQSHEYGNRTKMYLISNIAGHR